MSCTTLFCISKVLIQKDFHIKATTPYSHRQHSIGFVDHNQILILIKDGKETVEVLHGHEPWVLGHLDHHIWLHDEIVLLLHVAVDLDERVAEQTLSLVAADAIHLLENEVK